ncbi:MAG: hypothetical protein M3Y43_01800 [Pseudomonadota bacterium]|nr:hypothetical protein [Pseudomonadota bacterium]MDQ2703879.1 hypothetical protein [Pseudomonadota bacterium]
MTRMIAGLLVASAAVSTAALAAPTAAQKNAIRSSCASDFKTYCPGVSAGGMPALQCLEKNMANLVPACQQAVKAVTGG